MRTFHATRHFLKGPSQLRHPEDLQSTQGKGLIAKLRRCLRFNQREFQGIRFSPASIIWLAYVRLLPASQASSLTVVLAWFYYVISSGSCFQVRCEQLGKGSS